MWDKNEIDSENGIQSAPYDVFQEDGKIDLLMEMPGVGRDGLDVSVDRNRLTIHGTKDARKVNGQFRIREINNYDYRNEFTLGDTIDTDAIDASIKNGIVTINLAVKESEKPRRIEIATQ